MSAALARAIIEDPRDPPAPAAAPSISGLFAVWSVLMKEAEETSDRWGDALAAAEALYPDPPQSICTASGLIKSLEMLHREGWGERSKPVRDWRRHEAQCEAIDSSFGVPGLAEQSKRNWPRLLQLAADVLPIRPATAQEAAMKYRILVETAKDLNRMDSDKLFETFQHDLAALAQVA